jgi:hypothetical protein
MGLKNGAVLPAMAAAVLGTSAPWRWYDNRIILPTVRSAALARPLCFHLGQRWVAAFLQS